MPSPSEVMAERDWHLSLKDMRVFAERVIRYSDGLTRAQFEANQLVQDAIMRNIELIGEAAARVPDAFRLANPEIAWREIVAMRNQLIHGYLGIDLEIVWDVITVEIRPSLSTLTPSLQINSDTAISSFD
jgi:uncharacterized protein with HEPN domain